MMQLNEHKTAEPETKKRAVEVRGHIQRVNRIVRELAELHRPLREDGHKVNVASVVNVAQKIARL